MRPRRAGLSLAPRLRPARLARAMMLLLCAVGAGEIRAAAATLQQQNEEMFARMRQELAYSESQMAAVRAIFARSGVLGQGNPAIAVHPLTPEACRQRLAADPRRSVDERGFEAICGAKYMAPLFDPERQSAKEATACIDQYEFPGLPCAYPVVWVRAREAAELCSAVGKRLCDAHEWEGACAGALQEPDYRFDLAAGVAPAVAVARMRAASNRLEDARKVWSYGPEYRAGVCGTGSSKSSTCDGGGWQRCGSNTYPAGSFPECRSTLGVYDLHGNAAEHMNLPLAPGQMASGGSRQLGVTEMKGSWFIFDHYKAHEDSCRWRAPYWHGSRVMDPASHQNYHLGFRCCRTVAGGQPPGEPNVPAPAERGVAPAPAASGAAGSGSPGGS